MKIKHVASRRESCIKMEIVYIFISLESLFLVISFFGNLIVIIVVMRDKIIRAHSSSIYIISIAIADLLSDLFAIPFAIFVVDKILVFNLDLTFTLGFAGSQP